MGLEKTLSALRRTISNIYKWKKIECPPEGLLNSLVELFLAKGVEVGLIKVGQLGTILYVPLFSKIYNEFITPINLRKSPLIFFEDLWQSNIKKIKTLSLSSIPGFIQDSMSLKLEQFDTEKRLADICDLVIRHCFFEQRA